MPIHLERQIYSNNPDPPMPGYVFSTFHNSHIPESEAVNTREGGYVHQEEVYPCPRCNEAICSQDAVSEHMTYIEDQSQYWCNACRDTAGATYAQDRIAWYITPPALPIPGYHSSIRDRGNATKEHPFRIGMEIEKEDQALRSLLTKRKLTLPKGWVFERDGSLNQNTGFEVITRAYNLQELEELKKDFTGAEKVFKAAFSKSCGGHISISDIRYTPQELSERLKPLFPLLMALYPKRLTLRYAMPLKDKEKGTKDRHHAFHFGKEIRGERIELRIPSAVRSLSTALWRVELISHFLLKSKDKRLTWDFMRDELRDGGVVKELLRKAYKRPGIDDTEKKVRNVLRMYRAFSGWYYNDKSPKDCITEYLSQYKVQHMDIRREEDRDLDIAPVGTRYYGYYNSRCDCRDCLQIRRDAPNERIREAEAQRNRTERQKQEEERSLMEQRIDRYANRRADQYRTEEAATYARTDISHTQRDQLVTERYRVYDADVRTERITAEREMLAARQARHAREAEEARAAAPQVVQPITTTTPVVDPFDAIFN